MALRKLDDQDLEQASGGKVFYNASVGAYEVIDDYNGEVLDTMENGPYGGSLAKQRARELEQSDALISKADLEKLRANPRERPPKIYY